MHSFDLVSVNSKVTACDIAHVPLPDDAVDAVVLSLALMGLAPLSACSLSLVLYLSISSRFLSAAGGGNATRQAFYCAPIKAVVSA